MIEGGTSLVLRESAHGAARPVAALLLAAALLLGGGAYMQSLAATHYSPAAHHVAANGTISAPRIVEEGPPPAH